MTGVYFDMDFRVGIGDIDIVSVYRFRDFNCRVFNYRYCATQLAAFSLIYVTNGREM
jgi:hypothetical protein